MARTSRKGLTEEKKQAKEEVSNKASDNRIAGHLDAITRTRNLARGTVPTRFNNTNSQRFWDSLHKLADKEQYSWDDICLFVDAAAIKRRGQPDNCRPEKLWTPGDVMNSEENLQKGNASFVTQRQTALGRPSTPVNMCPIPGGKPGVRLVFCMLGKPRSLECELGMKSIEIFVKNPHKSSMLDHVTSDQLEAIQMTLGHGMCWKKDFDNYLVQNVILTMLWAQYTGRMTVEFCDWDDLLELVNNKPLIPHNEPNQHVVILHYKQQPHWTESMEIHDEWSKSCALDQFNTKVSSVVAGSAGRITCYPSMGEMIAYLSASSDVRILDAIAAAEDTPEKYRFRPRVCYGDEEGCSLGDYRGEILVHGGSMNMKPIVCYTGKHNDADLVSLLDCDATTASVNKRKRGSRPVKACNRRAEGTNYFHQELVPTLRTWGEAIILIFGNKIVARVISTGTMGTDEHYVSALNVWVFAK
ncbi:hypothetical protein FSARC_14129 [Fusarium sarcochroum]|uniref:Uncharacterized protein n=1 Tax=Fusarium sarcochroum TaxID=1208366 RepID=A0A8H4SW53_9HYPO|nr:hypothetical protein FSARC_14129 [Fusarium sarcochroum]